MDKYPLTRYFDPYVPPDDEDTGGHGGSGGGGSVRPKDREFVDEDGFGDISRVFVEYTSPYLLKLDISDAADSLWTGEGTVYNIYKFEANRNDDEITNAEISFKVNSFWIENNNVDPDSIVLYRRPIEGHSWEKLTTDRSGYVYTAYSSGFSYFAIIAKIPDVEPEETEETNQTTVIPPVKSPEFDEPPEIPDDSAWWLISKKELHVFLEVKEMPNKEFWGKLKEGLQPIGGFLCDVARAYCGEETSLPDYNDMLDWLGGNKGHKSLKKYEIKIDLMKQKEIIIHGERTPLKPHLKNRWNDLKKKSNKIKMI